MHSYCLKLKQFGLLGILKLIHARPKLLFRMIIGNMNDVCVFFENLANERVSHVLKNKFFGVLCFWYHNLREIDFNYAVNSNCDV